MGKVDGCGYNGQQKDAICDTHAVHPFTGVASYATVMGCTETIQSTLEPFFHRFRLIGYAYELFSCLDDIETW